MQNILLLSGAYTNGGAFKAAGESLIVGDEPSQISDARATDMVTAGYAQDPDADAPKAPKGKASSVDA